MRQPSGFVALYGARGLIIGILRSESFAAVDGIICSAPAFCRLQVDVKVH